MDDTLFGCLEQKPYASHIISEFSDISLHLCILFFYRDRESILRQIVRGGLIGSTAKIAPPKPSDQTLPASPHLTLKLPDMRNKGLDGKGVNPLKGPPTLPREVDAESERTAGRVAGQAGRKALQMD